MVEEVTFYFEDENIPLDGTETSDIIIFSSKTKMFFNAVTKKTSGYINNVIGNKNFLLFNMFSDKSFVNDLGFYIKHDKLKDILIVVLCKLYVDIDDKYNIIDACWKETSRYYVGRTNVYGTIPSNSYIRQDICGQTLLPVEESKNGVRFNAKDEIYYVYSSGAKKEILDFFGGAITRYACDITAFSYRLNTNKELFNMLSFYKSYICHSEEINTKTWFRHKEKAYESTFFGGVPVFDGALYKRSKNLPVNKEAMSAMIDMTKKWWLEIAKEALLREEHADADRLLKLSIFQNIDGKMHLRLFAPALFHKKSMYDVDIQMVEIMDYVIDDLYGEQLMGVIASMYSTTVWCDENVKGTVMENSAIVVRDAIKLLNDSLKTNASVWQALVKTDENMYEKYDISLASIPQLAVGLSTCPQFVRLLKLSGYENNQTYRYLQNELMHYCVLISPEAAIDKVFGDYNADGKKINEIIKVPAGFLEYVLEKEKGYNVIGLCKIIWRHTNEINEYFMRMNKDDIALMYAFFEEMGWDFYEDVPPDCLAIMLRRMIMLFGYEKWKSYVKQIMSFGDSKEEQTNLCLYKDYIELLYELPKEAVKNAQWKLKGEALKKSFKSLSFVKDCLSFKNYDELVCLFEEKQTEWKKFEYKDGEFIIIAPDSVESVIKEGIDLRSCVKEFVEPIAFGRTTILFIRKISEPDKPYFTLEVCDGVIRQCCGKCNQPVGNDKLKKFLEDFCIKNNMPIEYESEPKAPPEIN